VKSVLGEFSSDVSIISNKSTRSDSGAPFLPGAPRGRGALPPALDTTQHSFFHKLSDHLHCTNRPFTYVLRKDMSTLSRPQIKMYTVQKKRSQRNITQKQLKPQTKSPINATSIFFNTLHLRPKDLRFDHGQWRNQSFEPGENFAEGGVLATVWVCNYFLKTHIRYIHMGVSLRLFAPRIHDCKSSSIPRSW